MNNKFLQLLLPLLTLLSLSTTSLAETDSGNGWTYTDGALTISSPDAWGDLEYRMDIKSRITTLSFTSDCGVTYIPYAAFQQYCSNLTTVTLPNTLTSIGANAFLLCTNLTTITLPASLTSIGANAFASCTSLTTITLPASLTSIGDGAFNGAAISSVILLSDPKLHSSTKHSLTIGTDAFNSNPTLYYDPSLTDNSVASNFYKVETITCGTGYYILNNTLIPTATELSGTGWSYNTSSNTLTISSADAFDGDLLYDEESTPNPTPIRDYLQANTQTITFSSDCKITTLDDFVFNSFTSLTTVTLPSSLESIGENAFDFCSSLTTVTLPSSLSSIGQNAFSECTSLASVILLSNPESLNFVESAFAFNGIDKPTLYYDPQFQNSNFSKISPYFKTITPLTSGTGYYIDPTTNTLTPTATTFSGNGWSYNTSSNTLTILSPSAWSEVNPDEPNALRNYLQANTVTVKFDDNCQIVVIPYDAFKSFTNLTTVSSIPTGLTAIDNDAFNGCAKLADLSLPENIEMIGDRAFLGCSSLNDLSLSDKILHIGDNAFVSCPFLSKETLTSLILPTSLQYLGSNTFSQCSHITTLTLPTQLYFIGDSAFINCESLTDVYITKDTEHYTEANPHTIYLGYDKNRSENTDKTLTGDKIFPADLKTKATLHYDPTTTYVGDDNTNLLSYFKNTTNTLQSPTNTSSTPLYYDLSGRKVNPDTFKGIAIKVQDGRSSLTTIK